MNFLDEPSRDLKFWFLVQLSTFNVELTTGLPVDKVLDGVGEFILVLFWVDFRKPRYLVYNHLFSINLVFAYVSYTKYTLIGFVGTYQVCVLRDVRRA